MSHYRYFYIFIEFLPFIIGTCFLRQIRSKFLFLYLAVAIGFLTEVMTAFSISSGSENTLWLTHIYFPLEFLFLSLLYLKNIKNIAVKKWMKIVVAGLMLFSIINPLFLQKTTLYSQVRSYSSIVLVVFALLYFYQIISEAKISKLSREPMVWVNIAVLMYFAASLFHVVLFTIILEHSRKFLTLTSNYFAVLTALFYSLVTVAFVIDWQHQIKKRKNIE